ncbi:MAG: YeeE/YedE family protein [Chloroflexi bacterium]|nr:YeeE/YedE family protein [Chloroflexota bacterium]
MLSLLKQKEWSPYLAGALLGVVYILGIAFTGVIPGASGAFENVAGLIAQVIAPALAANTYFKFVMPPEISWEVIMLAGVFAGAFVSAKLSGDFKLAAVPDAQWRKVFGSSIWKRWAIAFLGGIILEYGAGIAGGCTSGLAVGGGLFLAPSAFLFMAGMFASGIPTALILYRRKF